MDIDQFIAQKNPRDAIRILKDGNACTPDKEVLEKQLDPATHPVHDASLRKDRPVRDFWGRIIRVEAPSRISLPLQRLIVDKAVAFLFATPVKWSCLSPDTKQGEVFGHVKRVFRQNKMYVHDRRLARSLMETTQGAELWYVENGRLKVSLFSSSKGDALFPYFDTWGDMAAFSREYALTRGLETKVYFETYTRTCFYCWLKEPWGWSLVRKKENALGAIPVVYAGLPCAEWADVEGLIERLEGLLSDFADTNDYHANPKLFVSGAIGDFPAKGDVSSIVQADSGAKAAYLAWDASCESVRLELQTLLKIVYGATHTPDLSFDALKGLGEVSGAALSLLFLDAHMKVGSHREVFDGFLNRRLHLVLRYLGLLYPQVQPLLPGISISGKIVPFVPDGKQQVLANMLRACSKPVLSRKSALSASGLCEDPGREYTRLEQQYLQEQATQYFNPLKIK